MLLGRPPRTHPSVLQWLLLWHPGLRACLDDGRHTLGNDAAATTAAAGVVSESVAFCKAAQEATKLADTLEKELDEVLGKG